jgi:DNA-binding MarR family transcriptional regulator
MPNLWTRSVVMTEARTKTRQKGDAHRDIKRASLLAWFRLARSFQLIDRATADHLKEYNLSVAQFDVLAQVGAAEGITQQRLADALLVTKGNVCQLLDRMEARNLVERRPAETGRAKHLYLTDEGRKLNRTVVPAQENLIDTLFEPLSREEQAELAKLLRKLEHTLS